MTRQIPASKVLKFIVFLSMAIYFDLPRETFAQNAGSDAVKLTKCSQIRTDIPVSEAIAADSTRVLVGAADGSIQAFESTVPAVVWRSELGGEVVSNILPTETGVVVISNPSQIGDVAIAGSVLRSLSKQTGLPNWTGRLPFSERFYIGNVGGAVIAADLGGSIVSVDIQTGRINWRTHPLGRITARPSFAQHGISLGTAEKQIFVVSPATGDILFKDGTDFVPTAVAHPSAEIIVVGDERGNVTSISIPDSKSVWKFKSGAAVPFVSVTKEGLFITSLDNFLYLVSMYNGDVIWKRRLPGRALEGGLIFDGYILLLVYGDNSAFLIETKKGKVIDQLQHGENNLVSRLPVVLRDGKVVISAADSILIYSLNGCGHK